MTNDDRRTAHGRRSLVGGRWWVVILLALLIAAGCGEQSQPAGPAGQASTAQQTSPAQPPATTQASNAPPSEAAAATDPADTFQNPVLKADFPDPFILHVDNVYYAYATNASGRNVQVARSPDLLHWELLGDAMPGLPSWAKLGGSFVWAPEAIKIGDRYVLYFTARDKQADKQCVGVATSDKPEGRFKDTSDHALVCQTNEGGSIDPSPFRDEDGKLYLYWKNDGNCCGFATYLYMQELAPDGLSLVGEPVRLVRNDQPWEGRVVEAPTMVKHEGGYFLFFSGNDYAGLPYAVGYATCAAATGPCEDAPENPILKTSLERPPVIGPGHQTVVVDEHGQTWLVYHAWEVSSSGVKTNRRFVWIDKLVWKDGKPDVLGPTSASQPAP